MEIKFDNPPITCKPISNSGVARSIAIKSILNGMYIVNLGFNLIGKLSLTLQCSPDDRTPSQRDENNKERCPLLPRLGFRPYVPGQVLPLIRPCISGLRPIISLCGFLKFFLSLSRIRNISVAGNVDDIVVEGA